MRMPKKWHSPFCKEEKGRYKMILETTVGTLRLGKASEYFKDTNTDFLSNENICKYLHRLATYDLHHSTKKKLEKQFENVKYEVEDVKD